VLKQVIERIEKELKVLEDVRDRIIKESRDVVKLAREAIHCIHRGDLDCANDRITLLTNLVKKILDEARAYPQLYYSGLVYGPVIEYVEAKVLYTIVREGRVPTPEELEVENVPYLLGLGDVVGELRRLVLDCLRMGNIAQAEKYFKHMEEIYEALSLIVVPDAIVPGLRGKVDFMRKIVEITRADLLIARLKTPTHAMMIEEVTDEKGSS